MFKLGVEGGSLSKWSVSANDGTRSFQVKRDESALKELMTEEDAAGTAVKSKTGRFLMAIGGTKNETNSR